MTTFQLPVLILSVLFLARATATTTNNKTPSPDFISSSCKATTYPTLCVQTLSPYKKTIKHNPNQLAQAALTVSLDQSESTQTYLKRVTRSKELNPRERSALRDCLEEVNDSLDRVRNSIREMKNVDHVKGQEFVMHMSNVQTWVSSALTDENTCMDEFSEGRVQKMVRAHIIDVAHVTSNALALINHFAEKHK